MNTELRIVKSETPPSKNVLWLHEKDGNTIVEEYKEGGWIDTNLSKLSTPSGDPLHWVYVELGAEYNDTDEDIIKVISDFPNDYVIHKARHWYLNQLGDITNEEMNSTYIYTYPLNVKCSLAGLYQDKPCRTNFYQKVSSFGTSTGGISLSLITDNSDIEVLNLESPSKDIIYPADLTLFTSGNKIRKILGKLDMRKCTTNLSTAFLYATELEYIYLTSVLTSMSLYNSPKLSIKAVFYLLRAMVGTESTPLELTVHPDVFSKAIEDRSVQLALSWNPYVTLAAYSA